MAAGRGHGADRRRALRLWRGGLGMLPVDVHIPLRAERRRAGRGPPTPALGGIGTSRHLADEKSAHHAGLSVGDDGTRRHRSGRIVHVTVGQFRGEGRRRRRGRGAIPGVAAVCDHASVRGRVVVCIRRHPGPRQPRCGAGNCPGARGGGLRLNILCWLTA